MTEAILEWIRNTFTADPFWVTVLISIVPTIEVRGAITVAIGLGMSPALAWFVSCLSALIVCPVLLIFLKPILKCLKKIKILKTLADGIEDIFESKAKKIDEESGCGIKESSIIWRKTLGVFLFVAIPLPLTGVWTGSAVAVFLDLKYRYSVPAIVIGNFVAGGLIMLLNIVLGKHSGLILIILMVFVIISFVSVCTAIIMKYKKKLKKKEKDNEADVK